MNVCDWFYWSCSDQRSSFTGCEENTDGTGTSRDSMHVQTRRFRTRRAVTRSAAVQTYDTVGLAPRLGARSWNKHMDTKRTRLRTRSQIDSGSVLEAERQPPQAAEAAWKCLQRHELLRLFSSASSPPSLLLLPPVHLQLSLVTSSHRFSIFFFQMPHPSGAVTLFWLLRCSTLSSSSSSPPVSGGSSRRTGGRCDWIGALQRCIRGTDDQIPGFTCHRKTKCIVFEKGSGGE
ncbi:uncharacterized protein LOC107988652 [Cynoglossus semilaevis]|uniref:uncharacterized protein LOC107988652 n=1 Tax=Cynoglossus semilaevis TaxID=244447 RepID=UPI0007DCB12D|nr:uncharacterized protein LOC107988652 [Cynoglossus semilaevis]